MSERADRRRPLLWIAALLLLAGAAWLLLLDDRRGESAADLAVTDLGREARTGELLRADGEPAEQPVPAGPALVGRADDPAEGPERGPVRVEVLGAGDHPLIGVVVEAVPTAQVKQPQVQIAVRATTDDAGVAAFGDLPYDGTWSVRVRSKGPPRRVHIAGNVAILGDLFDRGRLAKEAGARPVHGPDVVLRTDTGLPLHLDVVSADTGRRLPDARWTAEPGFAIQSRLGGTSERRGVPLAVRHGEDAQVEVRLTAVPHEHLRHEAATWAVRVHPAARRLVATLPLRPEARVLVTFDEPAGVPPRTTWKPTCMLGDVRLKDLRASADAYGRWRVRGIPHIPGERIRVGGTYGSWGLRAKGRLPLDPAEALHLHAKLHPVHRTTVAKRVDLQGRFAFGATVVRGPKHALQVLSASTTRLQLGEFVKLWVKLEPHARTAPPKKPPAFDVLVHGPDGEPVRGAQVTIRKQGAEKAKPGTTSTNRQGVARFERLAPGAYDLTVWGAGAPFRRTIDVSEGGAGSAMVRGEVGGEVQVFVVDADGEPMPCATLAVAQPSRLPWADVWDGRQRIDPFTDSLGRRILHNVEAGEVKITARLGWRVGSATVQVPAGGSTHGRIVLDWPKAPAANDAQTK